MEKSNELSTGPVTKNITISISYDLSTPPSSDDELNKSYDPKADARRIRNKLAAARCRKRRMDQTSDLMSRVTGLQKRTHLLQNEMCMLRAQKSKLIMLLNEHRANCKLNRQQLLLPKTIVPVVETVQEISPIQEEDPKTKAANILFNFGCLIDESGSMPA